VNDGKASLEYVEERREVPPALTGSLFNISPAVLALEDWPSAMLVQHLEHMALRLGI
jgi:hypothetical protein